MQRRIGNIRLAEALHQSFQPVLFADAAGIQAHPGTLLPFHGRPLFRHGNIRVSLQNHIGLAAVIDILIHGLGQQHIVGAMPDYEIGHPQIQPAAPQHIRQVGNNAHAPAAPHPGRQQSEKRRRPVEHIHHHYGISFRRPAYQPEARRRHMEQLADWVAVNRDIPVIRPSLPLRRKMDGIPVHQSPVQGRGGNHIHPGMLRQPLNEQAVIFLRLKGRFFRRLTEQLLIRPVGTGCDRVNNMHGFLL